MDSDIYFKEDRPHALFIDEKSLGNLLTSSEINLQTKKRSKGKNSIPNDLLSIVENEIPVGIIYSGDTASQEYHDIVAPVDLSPSAHDLTMLQVNIFEPEDESSTKRKRHGKDKSAVTKTLLFNIQLLGDAQKIWHEASLLRSTYPRNMTLFIEPPLLRLEIIHRDGQQVHLKGGISYSLKIENSVNSLGFFAMKSRTVSSLLKFVTQDDVFIRKTEDIPISVDAGMFYDTISEKKQLEIPEMIELPQLASKLLRYQRETVRWMLRKEGKDIENGENGTVVIDLDREIFNNVVSPPAGWRKVGNLWINPYSGAICSDEFLQNHLSSDYQAFTGGLLAEEMGLGKTVEIIGLILLNRRPIQDEGQMVYDSYAARTVRKVKTTLIISPASISRQFIDELAQHAPSLKVYYYKGVKQTDHRLTAEELSQYDVIITHYRVISAEIHYVLFNPEARSTRRNSIHPYLEALKSPLMQLEFWRVVLDEAQMVSSGVSAAAKVARMIPRVYAWAVTGTPVEKNLDDLQGILTFLRHPTFSESNQIWKQLLASPADFCDLFSHLAIRHTAHMVKDDIVIPRQNRVSVHLNFNAVEEVNYNELYAEFLYTMGLIQGDNGEITASNGENVSLNSLDYGKLASWFQKLRQACSHPRVGRNRVSLRGNVFKTIKDILDNMLNQSFDTLSSAKRGYYVAMLERGQINEHLKAPEQALMVWKTGMKEVERIVEELREEVVVSKAAKRLEKAKETEEKDTKDHEIEEEDDDDNEIKDKRARLRSWLELLHRYYFFVATANYQLAVKKEEEVNETNDNESNGKEDDIAMKEPKEDDRTKMSIETIQIESRYAELASLNKYNMDNEQFTKMTVDSLKSEEMKYYDLAQELRQELLHDATTKVEKNTKKFKKNLKDLNEKIGNFTHDSHDFYQLAKRPDLSLKERFMLMGYRLNKQASTINEWRKELYSLLTQKLVDQNADPDGEEYSDSLDDQEKAFSYLEVLQQMVSDRSEAITGTFDPVVNSAVKFQRNKTQNSREARDRAKETENDENRERKRLKISNGEQDQKSEFQLSVENQRKACYPVHQRSLNEMLESYKLADDDCGSLTSDDLREIGGFIADFTSLLSNSKKELNSLNREIVVYRNVYNARVAYYKQLQELSDSVTSFYENEQVPWDKAIAQIHQQILEESDYLKEIHKEESRKTYLESLKRPDDQLSKDDRQCIVCLDEIIIGSLTVCGHRFCRACLQIWLARRGKCPLCQTRLLRSQVYNFTIKRAKVADVEKDHHHEENEHTRSNPIYREVNRELLNEIFNDKSDSVVSMYGTKIEMILKHLNWLRSNDPTCQVVIFSQWAEMLDLLDYVLKIEQIKHASVKSHMDDFKKNPEYACFLLHAKNESAGLTLVNATHVYLCEPLVNTALEVQAISRIHRIGQTRATTVWLFVVRDTVEEAVLKLTTERRLEFLTGDGKRFDKIDKLSTEDIAVGNSHELTKSVGSMINKKFSGGEAVEREDLIKVMLGGRGEGGREEGN